MAAKKVIVIDLTNVSREEQEELKQFLEDNCWDWKEKQVKSNP
jgi:hypothetical protein